MYRKVIDNTWADYRKAHNLPDDWMPPKTAQAYLMRVYDTVFLGSHDGEKLWMETVTKWLEDSDKVIAGRMEPIRNVEDKIAQHKINHEELIRWRQ